MQQTILRETGNFLQICADPETIQLLGITLIREEYVPTESFRYGTIIAPTAKPLWTPAYKKTCIWDEIKVQADIPPAIQISAGLTGLVEATLRFAGVEYAIETVRGHREIYRSSESERYRRECDFIENVDRGVIKFQRSLGLLENLLQDIIREFSDARVLIATFYQCDAQRIHKSLQKYGVEHGYVLKGHETAHHGQSPPRISISTFSGIGSGVVEGRTIDLALFLQPSHLFDYRYRTEILQELPSARMIGLQVDDVDLNESQRLKQESIFGHRDTTTSRFRQRKVVCHFVEFDGLQPKRSGKNILETRRKLFQNHNARNRKIGQLAKAISRNHTNKIYSVSKQLASEIGCRNGLRVAVVAANQKHARRIRQVLGISKPSPPDPCAVTFATVPANIPLINSTAKWHKKLSVDPIVITLAELGDRDIPAFDVLVRGDGIPGPLPSAFFNSNRLNDAQELLIVDCDDKFHPLARANTQQRKAHYLKDGYTVFGGPAHCEIKQTASRARELFVPYAESATYWFQPAETLTRSEPEHQYQRRRARHRKANKANSRKDVISVRALDREALFESFRQLRREGGLSPGIDGIRPLDVSPSEMGEIVKELAETIEFGFWSPQQTRVVQISKPGSRELRKLQLSVLLDRVVYRSLNNLLSPIFDKRFDPKSFGFRPKRGSHIMLAEIKATIEKTGRALVVNADIRKAFDNVRLADVVDLHAKEFKKPRLGDSLIDLIETAMRGHGKSEFGLAQGNAYSPFSLNLLLHYVHDIRLNELDVAPFWFRYADNLVYLTRDVNEGERVIGHVSALLKKANLAIKPDRELVDLSDNGSTDILGFRLYQREGVPLFKPMTGYDTKLTNALINCWGNPDPHRSSHHVLAQWINQHAPSFDLGRDACYFKRIVQVASRCDFEPDLARLESCVADAVQRWRKHMTRARRRIRRK